MTNRFDLEQDILYCWHITTDLDTLTKQMVSNNMTIEQVSVLIESIKRVYDMRFEELFNTFSQCPRNEI